MFKMKEVWEKKAENRLKEKVDLDKLGVPKAFERDRIAIWLKEVPKKENMKMLDGGCSIGDYVIIAKSLGFNAYGVDISEIAIKECKKRNLNCVLGNVKKLPFKDETFNVVTSGGVIEHFPDSEKAIAEASRVLKSGGILLIGVPYRYSFFVIVKLLQMLFRLWPLGYEKSFSKRKFTKMLERNGFEIVRFMKKPVGKGRRIPLVSNIIRFVDKILGIFNLGGHHMTFWCVKK